MKKNSFKTTLFYKLQPFDELLDDQLTIRSENIKENELENFMDRNLFDPLNWELDLDFNRVSIHDFFENQKHIVV
jgi:hypothetical protein